MFPHGYFSLSYFPNSYFSSVAPILETNDGKAKGMEISILPRVRLLADIDP